MIHAILDGGWKSIATACFLIIMSVASVASMIMEITRLKREMANIPLNGEQPQGSWEAIHRAYDACKLAGYTGAKMARRMEGMVMMITRGRAGASTALASVGANAPYVGLFGTVIGIYGALKVISTAKSVTPDQIAGPVGEALVMTAFGLLVAIPAVIGYNFVVHLRKRHEAMLQSYAVIVLTGSRSGAHMRNLQPKNTNNKNGKNS